VKTFSQLVYLAKRLRKFDLDEDWDRIESYYPFMVEAGQTITLASFRKHTFKKAIVFDSIDDLSLYVLTGGSTPETEKLDESPVNLPGDK
jgi:hypothetical protein